MGEQITVSGRPEFFAARRLSLREVEAPVPSAREREGRDRLWDEATRGNPEMFDGLISLSMGLSLEADGHLVIRWARSRYRNFLLREVEGATSWRPALFAAVLQPDTDGNLVVGQMAAWTANPGRWQLPGGSVDPPAVGEPLDLEGVRRHAALEAKEEIGRVGGAGELSLWSVLRGEQGNIGVLFRARPEPARVVRQWFQDLRGADAAAGRSSEFDEITLVGSQDDVKALGRTVGYLASLVCRFGVEPVALGSTAVVCASVEGELLDWLLDADPALRWQVERDLAGRPEEVWAATRARVATEGFGARLLGLQDADGQWAGGAYFPRGDVSDPNQDDGDPDQDDGGGQPWTATTWTLNALRDWGLDPAALAGTADLLAANSRWEYENLPYWGGEVDCCINAFTLANGAWLGADVSGIARWFVDHQMPEGGWNCEWVEGSTRSSFHSTLNSLKGILYHEAATGGCDQLREARKAGEEYLLKRRLLHKLSTGEVVGPWTTLFSYPLRWTFTALNATDYFRAAAIQDGVEPDPRLAEAIEIVRAARQPDGTWLRQEGHPGEVWFEVDVPPGEPSKWLTFHAIRVLTWWDAATS